MQQPDSTAVTNSSDMTANRAKSALRSRQFWGWLLLIVAVSAALRLWRLDFQSYWYDELFSAHISAPDRSLRAVVRLTVADVHPPLYQALLWIAYKLLGYTEWVGRLPSVISGVFTIAGIALLGRSLYGAQVGLYAAALATLNYYLLYFSQEARSYSLLVCLFVFSMYFFVRVLQEDSRRCLIAYVLVTLALFYTHHFGLLVLPVQGVALLLWSAARRQLDPRLFRQALLALALLLAGLLPLIVVIIGHATLDTFWIWQPSAWIFINYFQTYFASPILAACMALLIAAGLLVSLRKIIANGLRQAEVFASVLLLLWIAIGYGLPWSWGVFNQPVLTDRNTIILVPALLIFAAWGCSCLPWHRVQVAAGAGLLLLGAWQLLVVNQYYSVPVKQQYREIVNAVRQFAVPAPVYALKDNPSKYNVYFRQLGYPWPAGNEQQLEQHLESAGPPSLLWVIDGHLRMLQTDVMQGHGLHELGRYRFRSVVGVLYVNPSVAHQLDAVAQAAVCATEHRFQLPAIAVDHWLIEFGPADGCDEVDDFTLAVAGSHSGNDERAFATGVVPVAVHVADMPAQAEWLIRTPLPTRAPTLWGIAGPGMPDSTRLQRQEP